MRSPLLTLLLVVLGWPVLILVVLQVWSGIRDWRAEEYPPPPDATRTSSMQYAGYRHIATDALAALRSLPQPEQASIIANLNAALVGPERWLARLNDTARDPICLGEQHENDTRRFLAREIFPYLRVDVLMLETTASRLARIRERMKNGRAYFPLHGANIIGVLKAVEAKNPSVLVRGIDETAGQRQKRLARKDVGFRDDTMARNFRAAFVPHGRTVLLFGAFHCLDEPRFLYRQIRDSLPRGKADRTLSVRVAGRHEDGPVESFVYFVRAIGIARRDFVIARPRALDRRLRAWFRLLDEEALQKYDALIVYGDGAG